MPRVHCGCIRTAAAVGVEDGRPVRITTAAGTPCDRGQRHVPAGHVALPNGLGLDYSRAASGGDRRGAERAWNAWKDDIASTPWHKHVPARLEPVG